MNPHVVGDGDSSGGQESQEFATLSFPETQSFPETRSLPEVRPPSEAETVSTAAADRAPETDYEADYEAEYQRGYPHEPISADGTTVNLPVRYGSGATTEIARVPQAADAGRDDTGPEAPTDGSSRTGTIVVGDLLVGVNAPDGTSVVDCPAEQLPQPVLIAADASARPRGTGSRLLERDALCDRMRDRLGQGRCVRLTGPAGSGRSAVLEAVAAACAGLAPAGVVQLSGHRRTPADLLQELFAATHRAPRYRPGRDRLPGLLRGVGAVVVVDDIEFGGDALEELLASAPECAFLVSATPDVEAPVASSRMEEVTVPGLSRQASLALLARLAGRSLDETERAWAVDLWFESEGLPLRFVQAGALLRHREAAIEALAAGLPGPDWDGLRAVQGVELLDTQRVSGGLVDPSAGDRRPTPGGFDAYVSQHESMGEPLPDPVPLPSVAESAAPAVRIARGLSEPARRTLRLATALGGECPTAPHLPALVDVGHGEAALEELVEAGLAVPAGVHHRLVDGVCELLADEWPGTEPAREAGQHFVWWTGHASVTEQQIADEAEVLLAVMHSDREAGRHAKVVLLARAAAPSFALSLRWGAWERALRFGLESARVTGAVAEEAWFHHELGVLGLCIGAYDRSRAELEASVALRAALGDTRAAGAGRTALGLLDASARMLTAGPVVLSVADPARSGLRRLARRADRSAGDGPVTRRQVVAAVASVVLMAALGSGIALAVGAFQHPARSTGVTVNPLIAPTGVPAAPSTGSPAPGASGSTSPSADSSASGTPSITPTGTAPATGSTAPGTTPSSPGTTAQPTPPTTPSKSASPTKSKSPTGPPTTFSPTNTATATSTATSTASPTGSSSTSPSPDGAASTP